MSKRVAVVGGGLIGLTTAHRLQSLGHQVKLFERHNDVSLECSFGNAALFSAGFIHPQVWSASEIWAKVSGATSVMSRIEKGTFLDPFFWRWVSRAMFTMPRENQAVKNNDIRTKLCDVGIGMVNQFKKEHATAFKESGFETIDQGYLFIAAPEAFDGWKKRIERYKMDHELLDFDQMLKLEPSLSKEIDRGSKAFYFKNYQTANPITFSQGIRRLCEESGVEFAFGKEIHGLNMEDSVVTGLKTNEGLLRDFDDCIISAGSFSSHLALDSGYVAPIYPAKGYSFTVNVQHLDDTSIPKRTVGFADTMVRVCTLSFSQFSDSF